MILVVLRILAKRPIFRVFITPRLAVIIFAGYLRSCKVMFAGTTVAIVLFVRTAIAAAPVPLRMKWPKLLTLPTPVAWLMVCFFPQE